MNNFKIEDIHKENFKLIEENKIKVGDYFKLNQNYKNDCRLCRNMVFKISFIHSLYGWVGFEETEQLPQEVSELLKIGELINIADYLTKYNLKRGE